MIQNGANVHIQDKVRFFISYFERLIKVWKNWPNWIVIFLFFSPIFLFFRMERHLFILPHQKDMKNVLNYWFKMVQMLTFKTRCDFLLFIYFLKEVINFNLFSYFLSSIFFVFLGWKDTSRSFSFKDSLKTWKDFKWKTRDYSIS